MAGLFYPAEADALQKTVDDMLRRGSPASDAQPPKAVIAPHAGYSYSGPTAGHAIESFRPAADRIERVVVVGPSHHVAFDGLALSTASRFETPLGPIEVDLEVAESLLELPDVHIDDAPHAREHALEVELPFLQRVLGDFRLIPLVVGRLSPPRMADILSQIWGGEETRVVVSSDLSHFLSYEAAQEIDQRTADQVLDLRAGLSPRQACGAVAVNGLLELAAARSLTPRLIDLRNSGDTAGDRDRVVGYGAFTFT